MSAGRLLVSLGCTRDELAESWSTTGDRRTDNDALFAPDKETVVALATVGQSPAPSYPSPPAPA